MTAAEVSGTGVADSVMQECDFRSHDTIGKVHNAPIWLGVLPGDSIQAAKLMWIKELTEGHEQ